MGSRYLITWDPIYNLYMRILIINLIYRLLSFISTYRYGDNNKITDTCINDKHATIKTDTGYKTLVGMGIHRTRPLREWKLVCDNGYTLKAAGDHMIINGNGDVVPMSDMMPGDSVKTDNGIAKVVKCHRTGIISPMFDATVPAPHLYYTNGILSHNTITVAIYIVWYILTNTEKNVMIISQNGDKVKELMDKIKVIVKGLPFYMKPGIITNNVMTMVFDNGCKIHAQTTSGNSGASFTVHLLYIDEFALISKSYLDEFYRAVYPTISSSEISRILITSTPRGMNKFYDIYANAVNGVNTYNPIRVDWYDVPGRDENWKRDTIADLGSEEDFNQEFGNQFVAGSTLLFKSHIAKNIKNTALVYKVIDLRDHMPLWYKKMDERGLNEDNAMDVSSTMYWHPQFDLARLNDPRYQFVWSIDIAEGDEGDYLAASLLQIMPMNQSEIDNLMIYSEHKDFFKMVQVGILRNNDVSIEQNAEFLYHLTMEMMAHEGPAYNVGADDDIDDNDVYDDGIFFDDEPDEEYGYYGMNVKMVIEMNKEGKYFVKILETIDGGANEFDTESIVIKTLHAVNAVNAKLGILINSKTKKWAITQTKQKVKNNQLVILEKRTVEETLSMAKDSKTGAYISQIKNDDAFDSMRNSALYFDNDGYKEQIDFMWQFLPVAFIDLVNRKLNTSSMVDAGMQDDYEELLDAI